MANNDKEWLTTIVRRMVILGLFSYFVSRVYVAYTKLQADKIGTLFDRITSRTVKVLKWKIIYVNSRTDFVFILN